MREILFRGKRLDNDKFVYGFLYINRNGEYEISNYNKTLEIDRYTYIIDKNTLGQYTGLKDKNGTKIFDGDIIQEEGQHNLCVVEFEEECSRFVLNYSKENEVYGFDCIYEYTLEVIGNIYDNPEL